MQKYSPFPGKKINDLLAVDLVLLKSVSEGWYVEYKRELNNPGKIAKSISSFANTYGGWIFYGVKESGEGDNTADSCPGIKNQDLEGALNKIRQSVASHINPVPHFEIKVIEGPEESMGLEEGYSVICVQVPFSILAPHIHKDGCIFTRVADSSEPKPEADRHQLDMLWGRRKKIDKEYRNWIGREPERSHAESERPYLRLLLDADLYRLEGQEWHLSAEEVMSVMNDDKEVPRINIDSCYHSDRGLIARQTTNLTSHSDFGLTWIIGGGLRCEVWIPLGMYETSDGSNYIQNLDKYQNSTRYFELLRKFKVADGKIVDLNLLWVALSAVMDTYLCLLDKNDTAKDVVYGKIILGEILRSVPFFDSKIMIGRMEKFGLPISLTSEAMVPGGRNADSLHEIKLEHAARGTLRHSVNPTVIMMELVCRALGLQAFFTDSYKEEAETLLQELSDAGNRAANADL